MVDEVGSTACQATSGSGNCKQLTRSDARFQVQSAVTIPSAAGQAELSALPEVHCLPKVHFRVQDQLLPCGI